MQTEEFDAVAGGVLRKCLIVLKSKGYEYACEGDRLGGFYRASDMLGIPPMDALLGMKVKHDVSVQDLADRIGADIPIDTEMLNEKITDSINYLVLFYALALEEGKFKDGPAMQPEED